MKTEVKFRELPEKVQGFLSSDKFDQFWTGQDDIRLSWLHNIPEWKDATDDERLAYAEWRYPVGTNIESVYGTLDVVSDGFYVQLGSIYVVSHIGCSAYSFPSNKWAEILTMPDIKEASPESQQEFVKANPGMQHVEEPKAGDVVDALPAKGEEWDLDGWVYLGVKTSMGLFVCEWTKNGETCVFEEIRLPQKSEVESKAKQLMLNYSSHNEIPSANYKHDSVMKMLIEIAKWGQANPSKI